MPHERYRHSVSSSPLSNGLQIGASILTVLLETTSTEVRTLYPTHYPAMACTHAQAQLSSSVPDVLTCTSEQPHNAKFEGWYGLSY